MSYYNPEILDHLFEGDTKPVFSIVPHKFVVGEVKEPLFIFDLPSDLFVSIGDVDIPSRVFDYFNPLAVDPNRLGPERLLFYRKNQDEPVEAFSCLRFIPPQAHVIEAVLESTVHYPPNFDIDYRTLTVSRIPGPRQLCELFERILTPPPSSEWQNSRATSLLRLLNVTLQLQGGMPPIDSPFTAFFTDQNGESDNESDENSQFTAFFTVQNAGSENSDEDSEEEESSSSDFEGLSSSRRRSPARN